MKRVLVVAALLPVLAVTGCSLQPNDYTLPGQTGVGSSGYTITVDFDQVENLVPNSTVQLNDVTVGTVGSISVTDWQAHVKLHLTKSVRIPAASTFSIGQKTLLGAQYVQISRPGDPLTGPTGTRNAAVATGKVPGPDLRDGDVVGVSQTGSYPSTEEILGAAALLLNNGGLSQISVITGQLSTALHQHVPDTRSLIKRTNQLLAVLDRDKGSIIAALESLNHLSQQLADKRGVVAKAIDHITPGLKALNQERTNLIRAVTTTGRFSTRAADVIEVNRAALLGNLQALRPILGHLSEVADSLPDALKIGLTIPFPAMTTTDAVKGDYANLFANIDLRLPGLAKSFLGFSTPAALQATNPVRAPLEVSSNKKKTTPKTTRKHSDASPCTNPTQASSGDPGASPGSGGICLLGLIGAC
jgi:phospholipid/cholesterol/gamma-HCH transport system substrate-binding protein